MKNTKLEVSMREGKMRHLEIMIPDEDSKLLPYVINNLTGQHFYPTDLDKLLREEGLIHGSGSASPHICFFGSWCIAYFSNAEEATEDEYDRDFFDLDEEKYSMGMIWT